jgi:hypothetical protein
MAVGQLENAEVAAQGIECFAGHDLRTMPERAGWDRAGNGPAAKLGFRRGYWLLRFVHLVKGAMKRDIRASRIYWTRDRNRR